MPTNNELASSIKSSLNLTIEPVAIRFSDSVPEGIPDFDGNAPAGCSFWEQAFTRVFATTASDHDLCSIGVHTHNLSDASASHGIELQTALQAMTGLDYVRDEEISQIPVMSKQHKYTIYGPLESFPTDVDVVLLFTDAQQGLSVTEAVSRVDGDTPPAMGRPACAAIPRAINQGTAAMSLGCCGARAYIDVMASPVALWVLPGAKLADYSEQLAVMSKANSILTMFHNSRKSEAAEGKRPTVDETLQSIS